MYILLGVQKTIETPNCPRMLMRSEVSMRCESVALGMEPRFGIPMISTERSSTDATTSIPMAASAKHHTSTSMS